MMIAVKTEKVQGTLINDPPQPITVPSSLRLDKSKVYSKFIKLTNRLYLCTECSVKIDESEITSHYLQHMQENKGPALTCSVCDRRFKEIHYLKRHEKTHQKRKTFSCRCNVCGKLFHDKALYKRHLATHKEEKQEALAAKTKSSKIEGFFLWLSLSL